MKFSFLFSAWWWQSFSSRENVRGSAVKPGDKLAGRLVSGEFGARRFHRIPPAIATRVLSSHKSKSVFRNRITRAVTRKNGSWREFLQARSVRGLMPM